jgi:hypothetical protein
MFDSASNTVIRKSETLNWTNTFLQLDRVLSLDLVICFFSESTMRANSALLVLLGYFALAIADPVTITVGDKALYSHTGVRPPYF